MPKPREMAACHDVAVAAMTHASRLPHAPRLTFHLQSDPNFIKRLISQLDQQMGGMSGDKKKKGEQIAADQAAIDQIDAMIKSHVQPNLDRLNEGIRQKTEMRDNLVRELALQTDNLKKMERDAAALISSIRTKSTKLNVCVRGCYCLSHSQLAADAFHHPLVHC